MKIRIDSQNKLIDGMEVAFRAPANYSEVSNLTVYDEEGKKEFTFADAQGNIIVNNKELFLENMIVRIILDITNGLALVQNSLTTAYLEKELSKNKSAYEIAVEYGFSGSEEEWLISLKGSTPSTDEIVQSVLAALPVYRGEVV